MSIPILPTLKPYVSSVSSGTQDANNPAKIVTYRPTYPVSGSAANDTWMPSSFVQEWGAISVSVIIPAKNEAANLPHVLPRIPWWVNEVILVDGHSTDDTVETAKRLLPTVRVVQQEGPGKGTALRTGFAAATGDIIVMFDADGSMDPAEIPGYIGQLLAGADFVKGTRFVQGGGTTDMTLLRQAGNWGFTHLVRRLFGGRFTDLCYGYVAFWRCVLPDLSLSASGFEIETEMSLRALQAGLRVVEVPSFEAERIYGRSNLRTFSDGWRVLKTIASEATPRRHERPPSGVASQGDVTRRLARDGTSTSLLN